MVEPERIDDMYPPTAPPPRRPSGGPVRRVSEGPSSWGPRDTSTRPGGGAPFRPWEADTTAPWRLPAGLADASPLSQEPPTQGDSRHGGATRPAQVHFRTPIDVNVADTPPARPAPPQSRHSAPQYRAPLPTSTLTPIPEVVVRTPSTHHPMGAPPHTATGRYIPSNTSTRAPTRTQQETGIPLFHSPAQAINAQAGPSRLHLSDRSQLAPPLSFRFDQNISGPSASLFSSVPQATPLHRTQPLPATSIPRIVADYARASPTRIRHPRPRRSASFPRRPSIRLSNLSDNHPHPVQQIAGESASLSPATRHDPPPGEAYLLVRGHRAPQGGWEGSAMTDPDAWYVRCSS